MKYCIIDEHNKNHIKTLIKWLFDEVKSAGGDGDALWYSRYYSVKDIFPIVEEINNSLKFKWDLELKDNEIHWNYYQEGMIITNKEEHYNNSPSWQQVLLRY
jgi:hypothetical protein